MYKISNDEAKDLERIEKINNPRIKCIFLINWAKKIHQKTGAPIEVKMTPAWAGVPMKIVRKVFS